MKNKFNMEVKGIVKFPEKKSRAKGTPNYIIETAAAKDYREKAEDSKPTVYKATISTDTVDRARDLMVPKGLIPDNFIKNPTLMLHHKHLQIPIGKVLSLEVGDKAVDMSYHFGETEEAKKIEGLYERGEMKAFSVGFYPWLLTYKSDWTDADGNIQDEVEVDLPDNSKETVNIKDLQTKPDFIIHGWELLEVSCVNVGCNQDALQKSFEDKAKSIIRKTLDNVEDSKKGFIEGLLLNKIDNITKLIKQFEESTNEDITFDKAIPVHSTEISVEKDWDSFKAKETLSRWASSDNTGDKAKINWSSFSKGFGWFNTEKTDSFSAYKFIHHTVEDEKLVAVAKGLFEAMGSLLGDKELTDDDKKAVYDHLSSHYKDANLEVPELKEYSDEELKSISDGNFVNKTETETDDSNEVNTPKVIGSMLKSDDFKIFEDKIFEMLEEIKLSLGARLGIVMDELQELNATKVVKGDSDVIPKITIEQDRLEKIVNDLKAIQSFKSENL